MCGLKLEHICYASQRLDITVRKSILNYTFSTVKAAVVQASASGIVLYEFVLAIQISFLHTHNVQFTQIKCVYHVTNVVMYKL